MSEVQTVKYTMPDDGGGVIAIDNLPVHSYALGGLHSLVMVRVFSVLLRQK